MHESLESIIGAYLNAGHSLESIGNMDWHQLMVGYACMVRNKVDQYLPILQAFGIDATSKSRKPTKKMRDARTERALEAWTGGLAVNKNIRYRGMPWQKSKNHPKYRPMPVGWVLGDHVAGYEDITRELLAEQAATEKEKERTA